MKELLVFLLPPAVALAGLRLARLLLGRDLDVRLGFGLRFALGLGLGMLVFSQAELAGALLRVRSAAALAWTGWVWGFVELALLAPGLWAAVKRIQWRREHAWLLLLAPVLYSWWIFARLSVVEGTLEFDAASFWVFKAKVLYLEQGHNLVPWMRQPNFADAHWEYPLLVPCLYTLNYGAMGAVDEFVNKVWPFWMMAALSLGVLSLGNAWTRPHPLPFVTVIVLCFLPDSLLSIRQEGGTMPLLFFVGLTVLLLVKAISTRDELCLAAAVLSGAGCAATKFEGMVFVAVCGVVTLPILWRRGWLSRPVVRRAALVAVVCLLPYTVYRFEKPVAHSEAGWWRSGIAAPGAALRRFPQVFFLNLSSRFFNREFWQWQPRDNDRLQRTGQWTGPGSLWNEEVALLPWLLLILLGLSLWQRHNLAVACVSAVMSGVFAFLSLAMACLPGVQQDLSRLILYGCTFSGRYYYPFLVAWFLALAAAWFPGQGPEAAAPGRGAER